MVQPRRGCLTVSKTHQGPGSCKVGKDHSKDKEMRVVEKHVDFCSNENHRSCEPPYILVDLPLNLAANGKFQCVPGRIPI